MDYVQIFKLKVEKIMIESNRKYLVKDVDNGFKLINFNSENIYIFEYQKGKWISKIK
ncbi:hypothetical protein ACWN8B_00145 [Vagococcus zengguangii]|uniref:hypothetical protein n=1 Tax=Vagococcus zengguangii TaxID=2571750 RepID=UPI00143D1608|nr:hypothetical protein [Vagococcus zengguangii]